MRIQLCLLVASLLLSFGVNAQADFKFEKRVQKFEKVKADTLLSFDFFFENTGDEPLIISEVNVSCGCTKPTFPKEPIAPGKKSKIQVTFDTKGKMGYQDRTLEIVSNASNPKERIRFKGVVDHKKL